MQSEDYQSLDTQGRNDLQRQYFDQVVKPQAQGNKEHEVMAWQQFTSAHPLEGSLNAQQQETDLRVEERKAKEQMQASEKVGRENEYLKMVDDAYEVSDAIKGRIAQKERDRGWFDRAGQAVDNFAGGAFETVADFVPFMDYSDDLDREAQYIYRASQDARNPEYREYADKTLEEIRSDLRQQDMLETGVNVASFIPVVRGARMAYGAVQGVSKLANAIKGVGTAAGVGALGNVALEEGKAALRQEEDRTWSDRGSDAFSGALGGVAGYGIGKGLEKGAGWVGDKVTNAIKTASDDVDVTRALRDAGYNANELAAAEAQILAGRGTESKLGSEDSLKSALDTLIANKPKPEPTPQGQPQPDSRPIGGSERPYLGGGEFGDAPATGLGNRTTYIQERLSEQQRPTTYGALLAREGGEDFINTLRKDPKLAELDEQTFREFAVARYGQDVFDPAKDTTRFRKETESSIRKSLQDQGYSSPFTLPDPSTGKPKTVKDYLDNPVELGAALRSLDADVANASRISDIEAKEFIKNRDNVYNQLRKVEGGQAYLDSYRGTRALDDVLVNSRMMNDKGEPLKGGELKTAISDDAYFSRFKQNFDELPAMEKKQVQSELTGELFKNVDSAAAFRNVLNKQSKFIGLLSEADQKHLASLGRAFENAPELVGEGAGRGIKSAITNTMRNVLPRGATVGGVAGALTDVATGGMAGIAAMVVPEITKRLVRKGTDNEFVLKQLGKMNKAKSDEEYTRQFLKLANWIGKQSKNTLSNPVTMGALGSSALASDSQEQ